MSNTQAGEKLTSKLLEKIPIKKILATSLIGAAGLFGGYKLYKWYKENTPDYTDEQLILIQKEVFKALYPELSALQKLSEKTGKIFNNATRMERDRLLASFNNTKNLFVKNLSSLIIQTCQKNNLDIKKYHKSFELRKNKNPEIMRIQKRTNDFITEAMKGNFLLKIDEPSRVLTTQEIKEIYNEVSLKCCNEVINTAEEFIKEKREKKEEWKIEDLKNKMEPLHDSNVNRYLDQEIQAVEGMKEEDDHHDYIFQASLVKSIEKNDEGIKLFLEQCDFMRKIVFGSLCDFKPDLVM